MLLHVPQQVVGHLSIAGVAVAGLEGYFAFAGWVVESIVAGLSQQAAQALLPKGVLSEAAACGPVWQPRADAYGFAQFLFEIGQGSSWQEAIVRSHEADDFVQIVVINRFSVVFRFQKLLQVVH